MQNSLFKGPLAFLLLAVAAAAAAAEAPLATAHVERRQLAREFQLDGVVEAVQQTTVSAQTQGQVEEILGRILVEGQPRALVREHVGHTVLEIADPDAAVRDFLSSKSCRVEDLDRRLLVYLDDGERPGAATSTIVDVSRGVPQVLREGLLPAQAVLAVARGELDGDHRCGHTACGHWNACRHRPKGAINR